MKNFIQKLEAVLNQGLYGRDDEVRLCLLCVLANKPLFLYGHDDVVEIKNRFDALFGDTPIKIKVCSSNVIKKKYKVSKYAAYCYLGSHTSSSQLYDYLFSTESANVVEKLKGFSQEIQKVKKYFIDYDFSQFWNDENKNVAIKFMESMVAYTISLQVGSIDDEDSIDSAKILSANVSDKRFKDFLHLLAINLIIDNRKTISLIDFGMFYYCLLDWSDGLKYLEETICISLSNANLPTFVFHDLDCENKIKDNFFLEYEKNLSNLTYSEFLVYVPYSSSPNHPIHESLSRIGDFHNQIQAISQKDSNQGLDEDLKKLESAERALKQVQLEEVELKETQLAQVQLKRSSFKTVKDGLDERLKIAISKETELREQRELLENKYKDSKIAGQKEGYESQIADVKAKEDQYKEIRMNLEEQLQDAKNILEAKLIQTKEILEAKLKEIRQKEQDVETARLKVNDRLTNFKSGVNARLKKAKEYAAWLRSSFTTLNKAIESCDKSMQNSSKPNPVLVNPLKLHVFGLRKIQKNLPNMIRIFDTAVKQYEERSKKEDS